MVKVAMSPYQSVIYSWVKATGTLRNDPDNVFSSKTFHKWANLNNKCMELRKVRHPLLPCEVSGWSADPPSLAHRMSTAATLMTGACPWIHQAMDFLMPVLRDEAEAAAAHAASAQLALC